MSTFKSGEKTFRYRDKQVISDRSHCYRPDCEDSGKELVDFVARWENVDEVGKCSADALLYTCADHQGPEFEEAKRLFGTTQRSTSAAYLTRAELAELAMMRK